ncbi:hypothetical protein AeMF1_021544 [Aphanomyces euteiches]|nr:hypothetical protein AeMF1_021544 [Aphanomyces euteiches]
MGTVASMYYSNEKGSKRPIDFVCQHDRSEISVSDLSLKLFGKTYKVSQPAVKRRAEVLAKYFYLDIAGVDADFDFKSATKGFFLWKLRPLVHLFTNVVPDTTFSFSSNVLRFYFCSETTPANLLVNSNLANHIQLDGKAYAIFPKGHTASVNTNGRQPVHCLNLDDVLQPAPVEEGQTPHKRQCVVLGEEDGKPDVQAQQKQQNNFEDPKKTAKRKEAPKPTAHSNGMSNNMYEVLRDINIGWTRVHNSGGDPLPTFVPDVTPPPKASYDSSSSIQKTSFNPTTKSLEWHPDAMSMEAIVQTLASVNTDSSVRKINAEEISLPDVEAVSVEISPLLQSAAADTIWTKIAANPLGMASYLIDLHGSGSPLFAQLARLHAWHRWAAAFSSPTIHSFHEIMCSVFEDVPPRSTIDTLNDLSLLEPAVAVPTIMSVVDMEDALAAFELLVASLTPSVFSLDEFWITLGADTGRISSEGSLASPTVQANSTLSSNRRCFLSCNINSIKHNGEPLVRHVLDQYNIVALQETRLKSRHQLNKLIFHLNNQWGSGKYFLAVNDSHWDVDSSAYTNRWGGVATIIRSGTPGFDTLTHMIQHDVPNRYLLLHTTWGDRDIYYHNVYAPVESAERAAFFDGLPTEFPHDAIHVVMGDFNVPLDLQADCSTPQTQWSGRHECLSWLASIGVVDIWRLLHPSDRVFSSPGNTNRLDYICASEYLRSTHDVSIQYKYPIQDVMGDHCAVSIHRSAFWRMPSSLLNLEDVVATIKDEANNLLPRVKSFLKTYNGISARNKWDPVADAKHHVQKTKLDFRAGRAPQSSVDNAVESLNLARKAAKEDKTSESFAFHKYANETSSKYFFRRVHQQLRSQTIHKARTPDGLEHTSPEGIATAFHQHWSSIMRSDGIDTQRPEVSFEYAQRLKAKLSDEAKATLDSPLTASEFADAIRSMSPEKSPGVDGFTAKFYQLDPQLFGKILRVVFQYQLQRGELLKFQRQSATALLYKCGDTANTGNYRPLALMPVETKILSKALAYRLNHVLPSVIHHDQQGFVQGRLLHGHVVLLQELQKHFTSTNESAFATFWDFEKAYDRVDWNYLVLVMESVGIGPQFIQWFRLLDNNTSTQLIINGSLGKTIYPNRGVKQGDPLSSLLFVLSIEPLAQHLRDNSHLGLSFDNLNPPRALASLLFADDCTLLSPSKRAIDDQLELVQLYCDASGARLNLGKCKTLLLNDNMDHQNGPTYC